MKQLLCAISLLLVSSAIWADSPLEITRVTASSVYPADSASYQPQNAIDNSNNTAWFPERTRNANRGEWIKFEFAEPSLVSGVEIINGWVSSTRNWRHNSRVKTAVLTLSSGVTKTITLQDEMAPQTFSLPVSEASWLTLTIDEIYSGDRWNQESGLTQVNILGTTKEQMRLAALRKEKMAEKARIARLSEEKQAQEKATYLAELKTTLNEKYNTLPYVDYLTYASDAFQTERYPEAQDIIGAHVAGAIPATLKTYSEAKDADALQRAYEASRKSAFAKTYHTPIFSLLEAAFNIDLAEAKSEKSSTQMMAMYSHYGQYYDENPFEQLVELALDIDAYNVKQNAYTGSPASLLSKYQNQPLKTWLEIKYQTLVGLLIEQKLGNLNDSDALAKALDGFDGIELNMANKKRINKHVLTLSGIRYRETFREGKIGERYVPAISRSESYNETRYINGIAINETKFNDYTTGGYDESRFGFTAVYQLFNESDSTYLVDMEISATVSNTEYKKKSSWSGPDTNVEVKKSNLLVKKITYVLKAGSELKDQIVVGEKKPADFLVSVTNITPVDSDWFDALSEALDGNDIEHTMAYFFDEKAAFWKPDLAASFARQAYMNLDKTLTPGDKFDRDFKSPVQVTLTNNNATALKLTYTTNFTNSTRTVVVDGNSDFNVNLMAHGRDEDDLEVTIEMLEPWR